MVCGLAVCRSLVAGATFHTLTANAIINAAKILCCTAMWHLPCNLGKFFLRSVLFHPFLQHPEVKHALPAHSLPDAAAVLPDARAASRRPTSYDVARLAGVSQSAVSRAMRDGTSIAPKTRAKVMRAAEALGYAPNTIARSLITRTSHLVAVLVTETTARNYPDVFFHLGQEIQATGNHMLVFTLPRDEATPGIVQDIAGYHVDGVISAVSMGREALQACERHRLPVVLYNRLPRGPFASAVGCDHATGMADLVEQLSKARLGRIFFLAGPKDAVVSEDRLAGARAALARAGHQIAGIVHADYSYQQGRAAARQMLAGPERPDTVLCANDAMALGLIDACRFELRLRIPDDVQVTGFDDLPQSAWPSHDLTTVRQPVEMLTRAAVRMLGERMPGPGIGPERRLMPAEVKLRGSTRTPADS